MKISKRKLEKIILEEIKNILMEQSNNLVAATGQELTQQVGRGITSQALSRLGLPRVLAGVLGAGLSGGVVGMLLPSDVADATPAGAERRMIKHFAQELSNVYSDIRTSTWDLLIPKVVAFNILNRRNPYSIPPSGDMGKILHMNPDLLRQQVAAFLESELAANQTDIDSLSLNEQQDFIPAKKVGDELIKMIVKFGKGKIDYEMGNKIFDHLLKVVSPQGQPIGMDRKDLELAVQGLIKDPSKLP